MRAPDVGPYVGRSVELASLRRAFESVGVGDPRVVVVSAESGLGKTRLIDEFSRSVDSKATLMLSVTANDVGETGGRETEMLTRSILRSPWMAQLGAAQPLVNSMRNDLAHLERLASRTGGSLTDAILAVIFQAARRRVVVLCADDLHWAEVSFFRLLSDLATAAAEERRRDQPFHLMMVLAHRPTGDEQRGSILDRLSRPTPFAQRLRLRPLIEPDVHEVIRQMTGKPIDPRVLERVMALTRGVPMLVEEAGRALASHGVEVADLLLRDLVDISSVARHRVGPLGRGALPILWAVALDGSDPTIDDLAVLTGLTRSTVEDSVSSAAAQGVLTVRDRAVSFVHPAFAEYVRAMLSDDERTAMHAGYVEALTSINETSMDIVRLAHHVLAAHQVGADRSAILAAAAQTAFDVGSYRAAARFAEAAAAVTPDPIDRARLWQRAGLAAVRDHDPVRAASLLDAAIAAAGQWQDPTLEAEVIYSRLRAAATRIGDVPGVTRVASAFLTSSTGGVAASRVAEALAELVASTGDIDQARDFASTATRWAGDDTTARVWAEFGSGYVELAGLRPSTALARLRRSGDEARQHGLWENEAHAAVRVSLAAWMIGDLALAVKESTAAVEICLDLHDWAEAALANAILAGVHLVRGDLDGVEERGRNALQLFYRSEYGWGLLIVFPTLALARSVIGDRAGSHTILDEWERLGSRVHPTMRAAVEIESGYNANVERFLDASRPVRRPLGLQNLSTGIHSSLAGAVLSGPLVDSAQAALAELHDRSVRWGPGALASVPRVLGADARRRGHIGAALEFLTDARSVCERSGARTELARVELELARALVDRGDKSAASDALDRSVGIAAPLGLTPLVIEAERLALGLARAVRRPPLRTRLGVGRVSVAVLMTDIVASTPMLRELGDEEWVVLHGSHDELLRGCIDAASGIEFAHTGDGLAAWFASADAAVHCGLDIHRALGRYGSEHLLDRPLAVRVGVCWGVPIQRGRDLSGLVVWRTARVMSKAAAGEVVVDEELRKNARHPAVLFEPMPPTELPGFDGLHQLYRVAS